MTMSNRFYTVQQVRHGESDVANLKGLEMYSLMERAGQAVFAVGMSTFPSSERWLICCGTGNNAGDGYIVASLARSVGIFVTVWQIGDPARLKGDAQTAYQHWCRHGGSVYRPDTSIPDNVDVVIDALLGTGLEGPVRGEVLQLIQLLNTHPKPVIAIDIPSGLCGNTGTVKNQAVKATHTVSFIGMKQGLVTGQARDYVGELHFAGLGVEDVFDTQHQASVYALDPAKFASLLPKRGATTHKGHHGKVLLIGGHLGMGGALILAASAALRCGAGMIAALCDAQNVAPLLVSMPEVMSQGWERVIDPDRLHWCDVMMIGPGLGRDEASCARFESVRHLAKPKVLDADALYWLAQFPNHDDQRVITPHTAEAARLLQVTPQAVEADRYRAVRQLQQRYGGVVVLKGPGTLVCDNTQIFVCLAGNPGMASAGMGDVLAGVIAAFLAQGLSCLDAANLGVLAHSMAADMNAERYGERGMLASDLLPYLRQIVNGDLSALSMERFTH